jgi:glucose/arabinose dehydrogenase
MTASARAPRPRRPRRAAILGLGLLLAAGSRSAAHPLRMRGAPAPFFEVQSVWQNLSFPAGLAFESDRRLFFVERHTGRVRLIERGVLRPDPVAALEVAGDREQGLLGLALHPDFAANRLLYVYCTSPDPLRNRIVRLRERDGRAEDPRTILDGLPAAASHNGGGLRFGPDGKLYVGVGDAGDHQAPQDPAVPSGKILRMNANGSIPADNPQPGSLVYALGIRNATGLAFHPLTGRLFATDGGAGHPDELNLISPGGNYGWPRVAGAGRDGRFIDPVLAYPAPAGFTNMAFYTGLRYPPALRFNLFLGEYATGVIRRVVLRYPEYTQVGWDHVFVQAPGPVVEVTDGPDGHLYFSTPTAIYRIVYTGK